MRAMPGGGLHSPPGRRCARAYSAQAAPDQVTGHADSGERDSAADQRVDVDLADPFAGAVGGTARHVRRAHPVSDLIDGPREVGASALDLAE